MIRNDIMKDKRPEGSIDTTINEIPTGISRIKIVGFIVGINEVDVIINDGSGQLIVALNNTADADLSIQDFGRFIVETNRDGDNISGLLLAFHKLNKDEHEQYQRLVKIEKRMIID